MATRGSAPGGRTRLAVRQDRLLETVILNHFCLLVCEVLELAVPGRYWAYALIGWASSAPFFLTSAPSVGHAPRATAERRRAARGTGARIGRKETQKSEKTGASR